MISRGVLNRKARFAMDASTGQHMNWGELESTAWPGAFVGDPVPIDAPVAVLMDHKCWEQHGPFIVMLL